jgi:hypothetical protein
VRKHVLSDTNIKFVDFLGIWCLVLVIFGRLPYFWMFANKKVIILSKQRIVGACITVTVKSAVN